MQKTLKTQKEKIEDAICQALFNRSREQFINEAKAVAGKDWQFINHGDLFEDAMDWLNIDALETLNHTTDYVTRFIEKYPRSILYIDLMIPTSLSITRSIKPGNDIWDRPNN